MRKLGILALMLAVLLFAAAVTASAADSYVTLYGFGFDINDDGEAVIHSYDDRSAQVSIPNTLLGAPVAEIDNYAFYNHFAVSSLDLSTATSLRKIGVSAFAGCTGINKLSIPDSVTELGFGAFENCTGVAELNIGAGVSSIPTQCFYGCSSLREVEIPENVTEIGQRAFAGCAALGRVYVPDTCVQIAVNAFDGCENAVIFCTEGSYAHLWAEENGVSYRLTDVEPSGYLQGDSDGDGEVSILDATKIQRFLAGMIDDVDGMLEVRGDADRDGELTILDATRIQRFLAGFENVFGVGTLIE